MSEIIDVQLGKLTHAPWNYKGEGTDQQIKKLAKAIEFSDSCGILAVRKIDDNTYEVIDGNHRLTAIQKELKWPIVSVENFGTISKAKAVVISKQRNEQWFKDDPLKLSEVYNDCVFDNFDKELLSSITMDSKEDLDVLEELAHVQWEGANKKDDQPPKQNDNGLQRLELYIEDTTLKMWQQWLEESEGDQDKALSKCLQLALNNQ